MGHNVNAWKFLVKKTRNIKKPFRSSRYRYGDNFKCIFIKCYELMWTGLICSEQGPVAGCLERGNELTFDQVTSAPWS